MIRLGELLAQNQQSALAQHFKAPPMRAETEDGALVKRLFADCRKRLVKAIKLGGGRPRVFVSETHLAQGDRSALSALSSSSHPIRWHHALTLPHHPFYGEWKLLKDWAKAEGLYVALRSEPDPTLSYDHVVLEAWPL